MAGATHAHENNEKKKNQIDSQKTKVLTLQNNIFIKEEQSTDIWQTETSFSGSLQSVKTTVIKKHIGCVHDINYVTHQHGLFLMLMRLLVEGIKLMPVSCDYSSARGELLDKTNMVKQCFITSTFVVNLRDLKSYHRTVMETRLQCAVGTKSLLWCIKVFIMKVRFIWLTRKENSAEKIFSLGLKFIRFYTALIGYGRKLKVIILNNTWRGHLSISGWTFTTNTCRILPENS